MPEVIKSYIVTIRQPLKTRTADAVQVIKSAVEEHVQGTVKVSPRRVAMED